MEEKNNKKFDPDNPAIFYSKKYITTIFYLC